MALFLSNPKPRRTGSWNLNKWKFSEHYDVESDDGSEDPWQVVQFVGIGLITTFHGTTLHSIDANQISSKMWTVDCVWETLTSGDVEKSNGTAPVSRDSVFSYSTREVERIAEKDKDGNAIVNAAGDEFNPAPVKRAGAGVIICKKNFNSFDATAVDTYLFKRNSGTLFGFAANQLLCSNITAEEQKEIIDDVSYTYVSVSLEFEIDSADEHKLMILEKGFRYLNDDDELVNAVDDQQHQVSDPILLDADGHKLDTAADPVFAEREIYTSVDFSSLGL